MYNYLRIMDAQGDVGGIMTVRTCFKSGVFLFYNTFLDIGLTFQADAVLYSDRIVPENM